MNAARAPEPLPRAEDRRDRLLALAPYLVVVAVCLAFAAKPFHIDDANFVQFSRQVRLHPLRPFSSGAVHSNPPGNQYLLALITLLFGESELALHLGLLPFSLLAVWGTQRLAERFGARPAWLPGLLAVCSGCFLLSATSLMPDVTMLGLLLPALVLLFDDERAPHPLRLLGATLLFATCWTLRFNMLPPLVLAALLSLWRGHRRALLPLAALCAAFAGWTWLSHLQLGAAQTLSPVRVAGSLGTGGLLLLRRILSASSALVLASALGPALLLLAPARGVRRALELLGVACFIVATFSPGPLWPLCGLVLLTIAWVRVPSRAAAPEAMPRAILGLDPDSLFLLLWALSGFLVPIVYNQSAAKYFNLPQVAVLILLVRAVSRMDEQRAVRSGLTAAALSLVIALPLLVEDRQEAVLHRDLVRQQVALARASGARAVYTAGVPWGVLVYGPQAGASYLGPGFGPGSDNARFLEPGDQLLDLSWPGSLEIAPQAAQLLEESTATSPLPLRLMGGGAGYWSSDWGVVPFAFSTDPVVRCWRIRLVRRLDR